MMILRTLAKEAAAAAIEHVAVRLMRAGGRLLSWADQVAPPNGPQLDRVRVERMRGGCDRADAPQDLVTGPHRQ